MVAVVTGNGLGLFNTSLNMLGGGGVLGQGSFGQAGGQALVNASNGNLVLQFTDRQLSGLGLDLLHTRTYNTQGAYNDADGDGWRWDGERRVALNGELNAAGSSVVRTTGDGHETLYRWNGTAYQSTDGDGAHDSLSWDATRSEWVWTDGSRRTEERYAGASGRLVQVSDALGTRIDYSYDADGRLSSVKDASGQELVLVYNAAGRLERLDTRQVAGGTLTQQVYYSYDAQGRLASVTTDLTPSDNSISDGKVYTTTYTYDGASFRIASVSQSDGTSVSFTYELVAGEYRVKTVTDASGVTTFSYDPANRRTDITNGLNQQWSYFNDEAERLVEVRTPAVNGQRLSTRYAYDADGNVTQVTDGRGNAITYGYDANGNRVLERDAQGNTLRRVYDANNQLLNEIRYSQPAVWNGSTWNEPPASSAQVVRYAYDASGRLRYAVSATGVVTEYRYNGQGMRTEERSYGDANYDLSALAAEAGLDEAQLNTWAAARNLARSSLTELVYDYRGNLQRSTRYTLVGADGAGVPNAATTVLEYIYGERGELLNSFVLRGNDRSRVEQSSFGYDGLGRLLSQTDASGTRAYAYDGAGRTVAVSNSAGLTTTQAYDAHGRLLSLSETAANLTPRLTQYVYDAAGRQVMVQDATGVRTYTFYDEAGRLSAQVNGLGAVVEYRYNEAGQKSSETRYATLVDTSAWYSGGVMTKALVEEIRPPLNAAQDRTTSYTYDSAGRLSSSTDTLGHVTSYSYDGRGQLIQTQNGERITRTFYDADGRVAAVLDGEGYLRENLYDASGRLKQSIRYALATTESLRAAGSLEQLRPAAAGALSSWYFYDGAGRQIGSVDEQGFVSETVYDDAGNRQHSIRYAPVYSGAVGNDFAVIRAAVGVEVKQTSTTIYDDYGRASQRIGTDGSVTTYEYDSAGRLVREIRAQGTSEARTSTWRYDALGQTLGKLTGEGASRLLDGMTEQQVQATYAQYGLTYAYDAAGRQLSVSDAAGNTLLSYYDAAGRLTHTVNKLGEVTETAYNAFGEAISRTRFHDRLSDTAGLSGGLLTTPLSALTQAMRSNAGNSTTRYAYDQRGQLASSIDALGYVTTYGYNRFGEQSSISRLFADTDTSITQLNYNKRGELIGRIEKLETSRPTHSNWAMLNTRNTATQYDAFGRVIARTDGCGLTSTIRYDHGGRVVVTSNPLNQNQTTEYDAFGRVLTQTDALGRVTSYAYDDVNRTLTQTLPGPGNVQVMTTRNRHGETLSITDGNGNITTYSYNQDGQLLTSTNALNQVTTHTYDGGGFKLSTTDAAGNVTRYDYDELGRTLTVTNALNVVTRYAYDGLGRKVRTTEAEGTPAQRITDYVYDAKDQLLQVIQDPDGLKLSTSYKYDDLGRQLEVSRGTVAAPNQQVTRYEFDHLGRRTAERVDPDGLNLTTRYTYNKNDQVEQKIQVLNTSTSYITRYAYDDTGKLLSTTDALGYKESYTYDAAGNRKTLTNKNGHVWHYNYDARNRLTEEISPLLWVGSIDSTGAVTGKTVSAVTLITYDKVGNVLSRTEGRMRVNVTDPASSDDISQARTTEYRYDQLNRQVAIISPGWYNKTTGTFQSAKDKITPANTFQVTTKVTYDEAGNAVRNEVQVNNTGVADNDYVCSFKVYDALGRTTHEIDALGGVTAYTYDDLGNQLTTKRHANALLALPANGRQYYVSSDIATSLIANAAADRTLTSTYDKAGRKVSVQQDQVSIFTFTGNVSTSATQTLAPTTLYTYDALGRVVKETLVGRDSSGVTKLTGAATTYYYDAVGNRTGTVDALGYYTRMQYDSLGRITRQVEYSTALSNLAELEKDLSPTSTDDDRITDYSHDAMGRVIQITRVKVRYWAQDATDFGGKVTSKEVRGDLIENRTTYDKVGNVRTVTDALNNVTTTEYNALGQVTKIIEPARWAAKGGVADPFALGFGGIVLASPTVTYLLNIFGQQIRETRAAGKDAEGNVQSGVTQQSRTVYDAAGHEMKSFDANNAVETYKVDVAGRRIQESQAISITLNGWTNNGQKVKYEQTLKRDFEYDKLGQQTATLTWYSTSWVKPLNTYDQTDQEYNSFGEVVARRINGKLTESYGYDQRGNAYTYTSAQQGSVDMYYDLAGNLTQSNVIGASNSALDDRITYIKRDLLGREVERHLPGFNANLSSDSLNNTELSSTTPVIKQVFDRWGNAIERIDVRNQKTIYQYDHNNRLWAETAPKVGILRENGTSYQESAIKGHQYDAVGRKIAEVDLVMNNALRVRHYVHDAVGQLQREVDFLGNWRTYLADAHGNRVATRDATGIVTVDSFDAMNRHITHGIMRDGSKVVLQTNRYDQAGRLIAEISGTAEVEETLKRVGDQRHGESYNSGVAGNTRYSLYDERGNLTWTRNESKVQKTYGFDAQGRKISEWDGLVTQTWTYSDDSYSRLIRHTDLAGRVYGYTYNAFGQLAQETVTQGPTRVFTYFENGLLKSIKDGEGSNNYRKTEYAYDRAGNKTLEINYGYYKSGTNSPTTGSTETRFSYDNRGRLKEVKTLAGKQHVGMGDVILHTASIDSLRYSYDEYGNRRRVLMDTTNQNGVRTVIENWYKYDLEGRALVSEGYLSDGGKVVAGATDNKAKGQANTYDAAGRRMSSETFHSTIDFFGTPVHHYAQDLYAYTDLGQLRQITKRATNREVTANGRSDTSVNNSPLTVWGKSVTSFSATYDNRGNRLTQRDNQIDLSTMDIGEQTITNYSYRGDGKMASQEANRWNGERWKPTQYSYFNETANINPDGVEVAITPMIDEAGRQLHYRYTIYDTKGDVVTGGAFHYEHIGFDTWKESKIVNLLTRGTPGTTVKTFTARGELLEAVATGKTNFTLRYASDRTGQMTVRREHDGTSQRYVTLDGKALATIGNADKPEIIDTIERLTPSSVDNTPTSYVVVQGDSLQGIAQKIWGDSSMWYLIADANGLGGGDTPSVGSTLTIPNVAGSNANNATTFQPYNESDVIGNITPQAKYIPPKPKKKKSGGISSIVMAVVAVVAAVFTAGAAAAAFAAAGTVGASVGGAALAGGLGALGIGAGAGLSIGVGAAIGGGIVGGAVGSAAGQLAGMAMGVVDSFSWSQVAVGALTGGIAAGVGQLAQAGSLGGWAETASKVLSNDRTLNPTTWQVASAYAAKGVTDFAASQIANRVVGLDTSFSWRAMTASAAGAAVGGVVGRGATQWGPAGKMLGEQFSAHASAAMSDKWFGGARPDYGQVAVDAFGNSLGNWIVDEMRAAGTRERLEEWTDGELSRARARVEDAFDRSALEFEQSSRDFAGWGYGLDPELVGEFGGQAYSEATHARANQSQSVSARAVIAEAAQRATHKSTHKNISGTEPVNSIANPDSDNYSVSSGTPTTRDAYREPGGKYKDLDSGQYVRSPFRDVYRSNTNVDAGVKSEFWNKGYTIDWKDYISPVIDSPELFIGARGSVTSGGSADASVGLGTARMVAQGDVRAQMLYAQGENKTSFGKATMTITSKAYASITGEAEVGLGGPMGFNLNLNAAGGLGIAAVDIDTGFETREYKLPFEIANVKLVGSFSASALSAEGQAKLGLQTLKTKPGLRLFVGAGAALGLGLRGSGAMDISFPWIRNTSE